MGVGKDNTFSVVHFSSIEKYPPILNFLKYINEEQQALNVHVYSTNTKKQPSLNYPAVKYHRYGFDFSESTLPLYSYFKFMTVTFLGLLWHRPKHVLYYEGISSLAPILYKLLFRKTNLSVHYHEYTPKEEYLNQNKFWVWLYRVEVKLYSRYKQISHTNEERKQLFLKDHLEYTHLIGIQKIYPNYPPKDWLRDSNFHSDHKVVRLVYVGYSLDEKTSYVREITDWLAKQERSSELDLYCHQHESLKKDFLGQIGNVLVQNKGAVGYSNLPDILAQYHVGLILYKGHTKNYIFNAPNKLFEYLACGLDVWFPDVMEGPKKYSRTIRPKIICLDFEKLNQYDFSDLVRRDINSEPISQLFYSESVYERFFKDLFG